MAAPIRIGVLGMAHDHLWGNLRHLADLQDAILVGGADPDPGLQAKFRSESGLDTVTSDFEDLLDEQKPDAVFCFTSTAEHADVVELCAERGIHVLVEKPMAATLAQADRMLMAARKHGTRLMINWPTAWNRPLRTAKRLVDEGAIGEVWQLTWRGGHCGPDELGCSDAFCGFLFDPDLNGAGAFNDYGGYGASMCVWFLGSPHSVIGAAGRLLKTYLPVDDNGMMILRYPRAMCRLEMTWTEAVAHKPPHDVVIYGTEGTLISGGEDVKVYTRSNKEGETVSPDDLPDGQPDAAEYFLNCIRDDEDPQGLCNPDLSRAAQEIMEAGLLSAINGVTVALPVEHHLFRE